MYSRARFSETPRSVAHQVPLPMGFSRQEYLRRLPFPPPGHLPNPGIEPASLVSSALAGHSLPLASLRKPNTDFSPPPPLFLSSFSELSGILSPRLLSLFCHQIKLNSHLSHCAYFFQLTRVIVWLLESVTRDNNLTSYTSDSQQPVSLASCLLQIRVERFRTGLLHMCFFGIWIILS